MGWFDWLLGTKYDQNSALNYVRTNPVYLKLIPPEKRTTFQTLFIKLVKAEISELGRNLREKEINTIVTVIIIRMHINKDSKEKIDIGPIIISINQLNQVLIRTLYETEQILSSSKESNIQSKIGNLLKVIIETRTQLNNLNKRASKKISNSINLEISLISELMSNIYPRKDLPLPKNQIMSQINKTRKTLIALNDNLLVQLSEIRAAA